MYMYEHYCRYLDPPEVPKVPFMFVSAPAVRAVDHQEQKFIAILTARSLVI